MKLFDISVTSQGLVDDVLTELSGVELEEAIRQEIIGDFTDSSVQGLVVTVKEIK